MSLVGLKIHALFNELYSDFAGGPQNLEDYQSRLDTLFDEYFRDGEFFTGEEALLKRILKNNLQQALKQDLLRFAHGYRICTEFMEKEFSASIGSAHSAYTLKGRIDRVDQTPSGKYEIIDYKTGKLPDRRSHFEEKDFGEIQLGFYGLLFRKNYPDARIEALSYYDLSGKKDIETIVGPEEITEYLDRFEYHIFNFLVP